MNSSYRVKVLKYLWLDVHLASTCMHVWVHALHDRWYLHNMAPTKLVSSGDHVLHTFPAQRNSIVDDTVSPDEEDRGFPLSSYC